MTTPITPFLAHLSGGDLPAQAVLEGRCLHEPIGCGKDLPEVEMGQPYFAEWRITGLCPDCQDRLAEPDAEAGPATS